MQFTHHNFYSNFTASLKSGDLDLTNDILANEISDFIVFDTDKLISALNKSEILIDKKNTDESIVDAIIKNISENKKLTKTLAFIIAEGNELLIPSKTNDKAKQLKTIDQIAAGLNKISKDISKDSSSFKDVTMKQIVSKAAQRKEYNRTIWNKDKKGISGGWALVIGMGALTVIIGFIYYRQKSALAHEIPNMMGGGSFAPPQPAVMAPPTIVEPIPLAPEPIPAVPVPAVPVM